MALSRLGQVVSSLVLRHDDTRSPDSISPGLQVHRTATRFLNWHAVLMSYTRPAYTRHCNASRAAGDAGASFNSPSPQSSHLKRIAAPFAAGGSNFPTVAALNFVTESVCADSVAPEHAV